MPGHITAAVVLGPVGKVQFRDCIHRLGYGPDDPPAPDAIVQIPPEVDPPDPAVGRELHITDAGRMNFGIPAKIKDVVAHSIPRRDQLVSPGAPYDYFIAYGNMTKGIGSTAYKSGDKSATHNRLQ